MFLAAARVVGVSGLRGSIKVRNEGDRLTRDAVGSSKFDIRRSNRSRNFWGPKSGVATFGGGEAGDLPSYDGSLLPGGALLLVEVLEAGSSTAGRPETSGIPKNLVVTRVASLL